MLPLNGLNGETKLNDDILRKMKKALESKYKSSHITAHVSPKHVKLVFYFASGIVQGAYDFG